MRPHLSPSVFRTAFLAILSTLAVHMPAAHAADWLLAAPATRVAPGQTFELVVIGEPTSEGWPKHLPVLIEAPGGGPRMALRLSAAGEPGPARQRYIGRWPAEIMGIVTVSLDGEHSAQLLLEAAPSQLASDPESSGPSETPEAAPVPAQPEALGFHEPMFFLLGGKDPMSARFQISFRYRIFDDHGVVAGNLPVVRGLYFGYTQTSLWDLESESKPFRDTSYRPSLFYQVKLINPPLGDSLALAGGYEHESNGRDGATSRSINTAFLRAELRYHLPGQDTYIGIEPKLLYYFDKDDNSDIARYRGYGQLGLRIGRDDGLMLTSILRRGTSGVGSVQFDLSYPLRRSVFSGVGTFVHLQYFNGYGETLLDYNRPHRPQIRIGVSVVR